ncbi:MAG: endopeptidase La [Lachnospiraceae bacterium]|nr:endopeptidase La [Lachnospiraceae bacterium]
MEYENENSLPMIPLRGLTVLPNMIMSFSVARDKSIEALDLAEKSDNSIFLVAQKDVSVAIPGIDDLYKIGTIADIKQILRLPGNVTHVIVEGVKRGKLINIISKEKYDVAVIKELDDRDLSCKDEKTEALMRLATDLYEEYGKLFIQPTGNEAVVSVITAEKPGQLADIIISGMSVSYDEKQRFLEMINPMVRLERVVRKIEHEISVLNIKKEIEEKVRKSIDENQKEYYLREQLKVIMEELGDKDGVQSDKDKLLKAIEAKNLPQNIKSEITKDVERFSKIPVTSPESSVLRNYIELILELPWTEETVENNNISDAEKILDEDHYGLKDVKERVLEFLAARGSMEKGKAPILCLIGPPGVGKTSIAKSIARALNRKYVRLSLGGIKDESEIRGHRKTYIGSMPGRIINAMKKTGVVNPVMLLDEVDKLGTSSINGDPSAALLEVLDSEQNNTFRDHYVEFEYDLSKTLFICTANNQDTIPKPLLDRMEIITLSSYTEDEKLMIAKRHLYPKQLKEYGLSKAKLFIGDNVMLSIINSYTREAGVRQLERQIAKICRKAVKQISLGEKEKISITGKNIEEYLGTKKYTSSKALTKPEIGVVTGLAWTQTGGETLLVEANAMRGDGRFFLTGNMGDVMKESAKAAISYIRSEADKFNIDEEFYKNKDIHIHIPEGAVPKDGPSAGVTMASAMVSALTGAHLKNDIAMTGEITIRGRVLPIGGLKEKILAAKRAGIKTIIIPAENKRDLTDVPDEVKGDINFIFADEMSKVLNSAIMEGERIWR